tara:strand:+ start:238 stop:603 length:366 start_codon:yes stop_codon:yes gene_type:complete
MIKSAFIGFLIAIVMLLPPIIHFITGPIGPLIGGFVAGTKIKAMPSQAILIGLFMGIFMITPTIVVALVSSVFEAILPAAVRQGLVFVAIIAVVYTAVFGSVGAVVGGHFALKSGKREEPS